MDFLNMLARNIKIFLNCFLTVDKKSMDHRIKQKNVVFYLRGQCEIGPPKYFF